MDRTEYRKKYWEANKERFKEKQKEYNKKNKEKLKAQNKENYYKNIEKMRAQHKEYYNKNKEKIKLHNKVWRINNPEKQLEKSFKTSRKIKLEIINHYSNGLNNCACCGENHLEFLTIEHKNHDGKEQRKGRHYYCWLKKNGFPDNLNLEVLCMNCNWAKRHNRKCPHETDKL